MGIRHVGPKPGRIGPAFKILTLLGPERPPSSGAKPSRFALAMTSTTPTLLVIAHHGEMAMENAASARA